MKRLETLCVKLGENDNVLTAIKEVQPGKYTFRQKLFFVKEKIPAGFKLAIKNIARGGKVIKYGFVIGVGKQDIEKGALVHIHNLASRMTDQK